TSHGALSHDNVIPVMQWRCRVLSLMSRTPSPPPLRRPHRAHQHSSRSIRYNAPGRQRRSSSSDEDADSAVDPSLSSSILRTPPAVTYTSANLAGPSQTKAKTLRRDASGSVDCWRVLTKVFGHTSYKGKQQVVVEAAACGADVFVLAPTGMGKSLCFQVPAIAETHGITLVVSPLLALMKNQVAGLREKDVTVAALTSETPAEERKEIVDDLLSGNPRNRLLYITPEKLSTSEFIGIMDDLYDSKQLKRLVVDEAHCISEWGHDFRADYRRVGNFRKRYEDIPIMALTATATADVQEDIIRSLGMSEEHLVKVVHPFNRANLFYEVRYTSAPHGPSQMSDIHDCISTLYQRRGQVSSGIVYCRTRAGCDEVSGFLRGRGIQARPYHRGINSSTLDKTLSQWTQGGVDVVCATIAFGLGIDKGDVRYIIHYDLPKSLEGFYQETGRAGRDGSPAKCILYYSREDVVKVKRWVKNGNANTKSREAHERALKSLASLIQFAESTTVCRHIALCRYFGETIEAAEVGKYCNRMCDICRYPDKTRQRHSSLSSEEYAASQVPANVRFDGHEDGPAKCQEIAYPKQDPVWSRPLGGRKRAFRDSGPVSKKARIDTSLPKVLITKPHKSAEALNKPYKPPFARSKESQKENLSHAETHEDGEKTGSRDEASSVHWEHAAAPEQQSDRDEAFAGGNSRGCAPACDGELPESLIDVDETVSTKVPVATRREALQSLRRALYSIPDGRWPSILEAAVAVAGHQVLDSTAQTLEMSALGMCSTQDGYRRLVDRSVAGITALRSEDVLDDEDAELVLECLRDVFADSA
ncbi:unnamed protein product, partial [Mycena citricolor]